MKTCFLHIGSEKTGTTSIQRFFSTNRDALLGDGFWYPRSAAYKKRNVHRRLSDAALHGPVEDDGQLATKFEHEYRGASRDGAHTAIISSEFFHSRYREAEQIERLRAFLTPLFERICVVYYARRQDNLAVSMHSTGVRGGYSTNRSALSVYDAKGHHYFDHLGVCDLWSGQFGRENFYCRIYDRNKLLNGDVVDDLAAIVGLKKAYERQPYSANESLSAECMNVLLLFNNSPYAGNDLLRRQLIAISRERGGAKVPMLTRAEAQAFMAGFQERNAEFFAKYVDPSLGSDFEGGFDSYPEELPQLTSDGIVDFLFGTPPQAAENKPPPRWPGRKILGLKKKGRKGRKQDDEEMDDLADEDA